MEVTGSKTRGFWCSPHGIYSQQKVANSIMVWVSRNVYEKMGGLLLRAAYPFLPVFKLFDQTHIEMVIEEGLLGDHVMQALI